MKGEDLWHTAVFCTEQAYGSQENTSYMYWLTLDKTLDHVISFTCSTLFLPFSFSLFFPVHCKFPHCQQCLEFAVDWFIIFTLKKHNTNYKWYLSPCFNSHCFFFSVKISGVLGFRFVPPPQQNQTIPQVSMQPSFALQSFGLIGITLEHLISFKMEFTSNWQLWPMGNNLMSIENQSISGGNTEPRQGYLHA